MRTLVSVVCLIAFGAGRVSAQAVDPDPARFAAEIAAFAAADAQNAAPVGSVLFVGSSTIRMWPTAARFPGLPVINRGFGGSHISDVNHYIDQTVLKYAPAVVVFYAGDNDIAAQKTSRRVLEDYQRFVDRVLAARPTTDIVFIAIKPSPSRWALWPAMRDANALIKTYADAHPRLHYADIVPPMIAADGQPRPELFVADRLHLSPAGYDEWTRVLTPVITEVRSARQESAPVPQGPDDEELSPAEPDFTLGALPTTLRLPARAFNFRLTHRFSRPIALGTASQFFADFFGMDGAARIGIELRYGLRPGTQVAVHRTNDRAIQLLGQQQLVRQGRRPVSIHALLAVEGADNFSEDFSGAIGVVVSRTLADRAALYVQPIAVVNANPVEPVSASEDRAFVVGLGARVRVGGSRVYLVAEAAPQITGLTAGVDHVSVGIERRAGGHLFQLTISNALGTTFRQIARGGANRGDWHVGFNLSRKFF